MLNFPFLPRISVRLRWLCLIGCLAWVGHGSIGAQEVIVSDLKAFPGETGFDELPKTKGKFQPKYPAEMKKSGEIGYVIVAAHVDEKGKRSLFWSDGAQHLFAESVENDLGKWKTQPGSEAGQPASGGIWMSVIFNPASSALTKPDSTPRLLELTPLILPGKDLKDKTDPQVWILPVRLDIGVEGDVQKVSLPDKTQERLRAVIEKEVPAWRFSPARRGGTPISATVDMQIVVQRPRAAPEKKNTPPQILKKANPLYPLEMEQTGMQGEVEVELLINKEGRVQRATVSASNHPGFNEAALEAARKWTFTPALMDGQPVNIKARQKVMFQLPGSDRPDGAYGVEHHKWKKNTSLPSEYRYDVPPKPRGVVEPVYPYELLRDDVGGKAEVVFAIDTAGQVTSVKASDTSHPTLGLAMVAAIEAFAFDPALKDGNPVPSVLRIEHDFSRTNNRSALALLQREKKRPETIVRLKDLDQPLKPISQLAPKYPLGVAETTKGEALIELLVDEEGRVQLPRIVSSSEPAFGYAAIQAVASWRFEKPIAKGKPAVARVRVPFDFNAAP